MGGMLPVDVIFLSDVNGKLRPLRIRVQSGQDSVFVGNVIEVLQRKENRFYGAESHTFLCRVGSGSTSKVWELRYLVRTHRWYAMQEHSGCILGGL